MDRNKLIILGLQFMTAGIFFYAGYMHGTRRMVETYGEVMSAEALMYLAAKDSNEGR